VEKCNNRCRGFGELSVEIVYVDTWFLVGQFDFIRERVEISKYLKLYPELHDFVLQHEKKHFDIYKEYGFSWRHFVIDIKDRFKLFNNRTIYNQWRKFQKQKEPRNWKEYLFMFMYQFVNAFTTFLSFIRIRHWFAGTSKRVVFVEELMPDSMCRNYVLKRMDGYSIMKSLVLDIGCGTGYFTSKFPKAVGVDISRENLVTAKLLLPGKDFILAEASCLPFRNNSFSGLISMEVLEHVEQPTIAISEFYRCLVKKGLYLLSFDIFSPSRPFSRFVTKKFVVEKKLWHKNTCLSDMNDETMIDRNKMFYYLKGFDILWEKKFRGLLVNLLTVLAIMFDKLTRPGYLLKKDMGSQYTRLNTSIIKFYMRTTKLLFEEVARIDSFKWDSSCVMVLAQKK